MDRYGQDVEKMFLQAGKKFPLHTVFGLGLRIVSIEIMLLYHIIFEWLLPLT